jgi:hypothetical protein
VALLPMFRSRAPELPLLYVPNDGHWSAAGHRLAAELLGETVAEWMGGPGGERHAAARSPVPAKEGE